MCNLYLHVVVLHVAAITLSTVFRSSHAATKRTCKPGWETKNIEGPNAAPVYKCYFIPEERKVFTTATLFCSNRMSSLVVPQHFHENAMLKNWLPQLGQTSLLLSINTISADLYETDVKGDSTFTYGNWAPGKPNSTLARLATKYCVTISTTQDRWTEVDCADPRFFMCERPICVPLTYGYKCTHDCSNNCIRDECDEDNGDCNFGCLDGYWNSHCFNKCVEFTYGKDCAFNCSIHCAGNKTCNHVNGVCDYGCEPGWSTPQCNIFCPHPKTAGTCGYRCNENCGDTGECDELTGACLFGCKPGWKMPHCKEPCPDGYFGMNCLYQCTHCKKDPETGTYSCTKAEGNCILGCAPGFEGSKCVAEISNEDAEALTEEENIMMYIFIALCILLFLVILWALKACFSADDAGSEKTESIVIIREESPAENFVTVDIAGDQEDDDDDDDDDWLDMSDSEPEPEPESQNEELEPETEAEPEEKPEPEPVEPESKAELVPVKPSPSSRSRKQSKRAKSSQLLNQMKSVKTQTSFSYTDSSTDTDSEFSDFSTDSIDESTWRSFLASSNYKYKK